MIKNVSRPENEPLSRYRNLILDEECVGGTFQLTTKEDALFAGVNVSADKINFDIGRDLSIISLQDEYKSDGKNWGVGLNVSGKIPGTEQQGGYARPTGSINYGENHQDSKWTGNQTSILAENGGNIKVGETLTNIGSIIGSLSNDNKLSIEANKVVVENLKDHNEGSNFGLSMGGIGLGTKDQGNTTPIGQTGVQYGSHEKSQDTNATFVNAEVTEVGKKLNLEEMGINTDISKAQVITKDEVVEQIDTVLHTDLLNETTRNQVIKDINGLINTPGDIIKAIQIANNNEDSNFLDNLVGTIRSTDSDMNNTLTMGKKYKELKERKDLSLDEKAAQALILANQSANGLRENFGIGNDVPILVLFADESKGDEAGAFLREDGMMVIFLDPSKIDMSDAKQVYNGLMYEMNHYNSSNPYVYDKKEGEVNKGTTLHDQEEGFTSIGRKEITGEGNKFYNEVLKGSGVVSAGNDIYGELDVDDFDYWPGEGIYKKTKNKCNGYKWCKAGKENIVKPAINTAGKVVVNTVNEGIKLTTGGNKQLKEEFVNAVNKKDGVTNILNNVASGNPVTINKGKDFIKKPTEDCGIKCNTPKTVTNKDGTTTTTYLDGRKINYDKNSGITVSEYPNGQLSMYDEKTGESFWQTGDYYLGYDKDGKVLYEGYFTSDGYKNSLINQLSNEEKSKLNNFKEESKSSGIPNDTKIIIRDNYGKEVVYNSFEDYYKSNSSKEQDDIRGYETKINQLVKDLDKAKTREEKAKINAEIKKYSEEQKKITDSKYVYTETNTKIALAQSGIKYKDGVLVVHKESMDMAVAGSNIAMGMEAGSKAEGMNLSKVQDLKNKYGTNAVSGYEQAPKGDVWNKTPSVTDSMAEKTLNKPNVIKTNRGEKIQFTNPSGQTVEFSENQHPKNIKTAIESAKNSKNSGKVIEGKVGEFVNKYTEVKGFAQNVKNTATSRAAGDLDIVTDAQIIEVKKTMNAVDIEQLDKLTNYNHKNFFNYDKKEIILYIDEPINMNLDSVRRKIEFANSRGIKIVNTLDELKGVLK